MSEPAIIALDTSPSLEVFAGLAPTNAQIEVLEARLLVDPRVNTPALECPVVEEFFPGVYQRTIFMRKGLFIIGHEHRHEHLNIVHSGAALVNYDGEVRVIRGPVEFTSKAGVRKMLVILEDMTFSTVHANPDNCRDTATLDERNVRKSDSFLEYQAQIDALKAEAAKHLSNE